MAALAAVVMVSAAVPAGHLLDGHDQPAQTVVLRGVGPAPRARAEVSIVARDGGTGLHLTLSGAPKHGWCSLVARAADGRSEIAATWPADGLGRVEVSGSTDIPAAQLSELSVVTDTGRRLVRIPVPHHELMTTDNQQEEQMRTPTSRRARDPPVRRCSVRRRGQGCWSWPAAAPPATRRPRPARAPPVRR